MSESINQQQVIKWLQQQAKKYDAMAKQIEADFGVQPTNGNHVTKPTATGIITLEQLQAAVKEKSGRPADFASRLNVTIDDVNRLVDQPSSGIQRVERGWLKPA